MTESRLTLSSIVVDSDRVHPILERSILKDGFPFVVDLEASQGSYLVDATTGRRYLDFFNYFATQPLGHNHPLMLEPEFVAHIGRIATTKPSNSDFYTPELATFVNTLRETAQPASLPHAFFVSGGALAVENTLKAAFDWKFQKRAERGLPDDDRLSILHFKEAFHGRSGYTMSLTNTDPTKVRWFPKFTWPRVLNPKIEFPLQDNLESVEAAEAESLRQIHAALEADGDRIAALIIEPIQGEGGDNHFRPKFFHALREICDANELLFIVDEVQTGVGATGKWWAYQNYGFEPDLLAFGKKMQVCGVLGGRRLDEVDSVFHVSGRINSTWGGNLVDMVRGGRYLQIIEAENLMANTTAMGERFLAGLRELAKKNPGKLTNVRGRGLFAAFTLPSPEERKRLLGALMEDGMLALKSGSTSIRFRPPLNVASREIDEALAAIERCL
ncbi:MAG TPA: L-lysine 6-transaminase [Candidatus Krumholzibacteria bacterium]